MATRLNMALEKLSKALQGRPYVVVFQQNHATSRVHNVGVVRPVGQPTFVSRGLCLEAHDFIVAAAGEATELSSRIDEPEPPVEPEEGGP